MGFRSDPIRALVLLVLLCACHAAGAAESAVVSYDSDLLAEPRNGAAVVTRLKPGMTGEVLARKGAWVNLRTAAGTGWVNSFNVSDARTSAPAASGPAQILAPRTKTTATIGIRGLEAEDIRRASIDPQQLNLLDKYAVSRGDAEQAARASGLDAVRVEYLLK